MKKLSLQGWRARPKNTISVFPSVYTVAYATGQECLKKYGAKLKSVVYVIGRDDMNIFMETQADYRRFSGLLVRRFQKSVGQLDSLIRWSERNSNLLYDFASKAFLSQPIGQLSNREISRRYAGYARKYLAYHLKNTPAWWIGALAAEAKLRKFLTENYADHSPDEILGTLIDPLEYYSENSNEESSLLEIAIKVAKRRLKKTSFTALPSDIKMDLDKHARLYSSVPFGYKTGLIWRVEDFWKRAKVLAGDDPLELKKRRQKERREKIITRDTLMEELHLPPGPRNLVLALRKLSYLQELKKTMQTRSHPILQSVVYTEIARRLDLDPKYVEYLTELEIDSLLKLGKVSPAFRKNLASRALSAVLIIRNSRYSWLIGGKAREFIKVNGVILDTRGIREIRGQVASKGRASGPVKVCLLSTEIGKVKDGDILVTAMTTPDFVPAMRKAAAIITDEGGITSHAAIVARELNKPCIIGAKIAAKVLHDNDRVSVDADHGIIKIL